MKKILITIGIAIAIALTLSFLHPSSKISLPESVSSLEKDGRTFIEDSSEAPAIAPPSQINRYESFSETVEKALQPMKGSGVKVIEMKKPPSKKLIRLEDGTELIELTFEHGGKTYLPKGEDADIGVTAASTR